MILTSPLLSAAPGVRHAFFTREGGVSEGIYASLNGGLGSNDDPARVTENRRRMAEALGVAPSHFLTAHQVHSPDVAVVTEPWTLEARPKVDAIVTATAGIAIGVSSADCGPILFADPQARIIGAAHAGWRGAFTGVLEATLAEMDKLGADRGRVVAAIGPLIRQRSYEVGEEFVGRFGRADPANAAFFAPAERTGHAMFDLAGYIRLRLERAGVLLIDDPDICTYEDERFFSYRRSVHQSEPDYGRHIHGIVLED
ncbi:peptidoglycan editing factor PgeF [Bradyrhizobium sp. U87765 SZCCT0131]|uniref:peptidoglycan editing factor PgeF n=1 Tax=unclassified Bradyrhizobium TaxID=2631580 RepID=UPI001BAC1CF8|nr:MULTISPECIES: peptidoglycan editing factor PgeF [unclassified Bradyrhizobium]MBR1218651.1 peptidoglycan editing factor PgeF [Bradyrhizobium sp. U87765 SZCCT0131]MBR1265590.1 peptidoglycan editing factor PgeF [Bradyrhizobium sp. U87765 SZCCT0134]MBR1304149.1 peptidoglycan editing factor PgeF [Bradyrhizobium sp. U87765 SZCCT0110]MBR1319755.1 peptidoglycan editing factor PgeF [Bradyrhizobium sp. U87765 SZCCT0109]MBR1348080.1 peptidoglycan editing factor PgeF [Bradyrhizobium sp. U87765 SZCCT004